MGLSMLTDNLLRNRRKPARPEKRHIPQRQGCKLTAERKELWSKAQHGSELQHVIKRDRTLATARGENARDAARDGNVTNRQ